MRGTKHAARSWHAMHLRRPSTMPCHAIPYHRDGVSITVFGFVCHTPRSLQVRWSELQTASSTRGEVWSLAQGTLVDAYAEWTRLCDISLESLSCLFGCLFNDDIPDNSVLTMSVAVFYKTGSYVGCMPAAGWPTGSYVGCTPAAGWPILRGVYVCCRLANLGRLAHL